MPPQKIIASTGDHCLLRRQLPPQETRASSEDHYLLRRPFPPQETSGSSGFQSHLRRPVPPQQITEAGVMGSSKDFSYSLATQCYANRSLSRLVINFKINLFDTFGYGIFLKNMQSIFPYHKCETVMFIKMSLFLKHHEQFFLHHLV